MAPSLPLLSCESSVSVKENPDRKKKKKKNLGIFKTHRRILEFFWLPGLYEDIVNFNCNCEICVAVKPQHRNPRRMGVREFPCAPMELVSIDFLVELPVSDLTAKTAAKCVLDFFLKFCISLKLYSGRDPN